MNIKGTKLKDKYILEKVLGSGGFGVTYLGMNLVLDIPVAVKEFFPDKLVEREKEEGLLVKCKKEYREEYKKGIDDFLNEARILAGFNNLDGVVDVYDFFEENNTAYIVMEYIEGLSVKSYVKKYGPMESNLVLDQMKPIVKALVKVHDKGLVHRDISADNIIFSKDGSLKLIDFGAARKNNMEQKTVTVIYKNGFSAPEQYMSHGALGAYTDIYSLGATFYYMLTGEVPVESVGRVVDDNLKMLSEFEEVNLDKDKISAIEKAMSVKTEDRFQSVIDLYNALYEEPMENVNAFSDNEDFSVTENEVTRRSSKGFLSRSFIRRELELERNSSDGAKRTVLILIALLAIACFGAIALFAKDQISPDKSIEGRESRTEASVEETNQMSTAASETERISEAETETAKETEAPSTEITSEITKVPETTEAPETTASTESKSVKTTQSSKKTKKKTTNKEKTTKTKKAKDDTAGNLDELFD